MIDAYDAFGNLTTLDGQTFTVDKNTNHITWSSLTSTWAYDALGNLTQTGAETLSYDALNRQTRETGPTDFTYLYNGDGERIVKFPAGSVLRREMARYIAEANVKAGKTGWTLTACTVKPFTDVEITDPDCQHIKLIAAKGISSGCGGGNFCPETALNRASMAVMLVKGYQPDGDPTPACTNHFTDAGCSDPTWGPYAPWIEELWRDGVTSGCGVNLYCPSLIAGEWEMLTFLSKAPTTPPGGYYWAAYHPVPRGSTYTFRDEQNRVIREATAVATGTASATPLTVRDNIFLENTLVESYASPTPGATPAWEYYTPDHLGTPRYVRFSTGGSATHKYWPYGAEATTAGAQRLGLATMERDMEANHFYDHARTEDFGLGRFLSVDKVGGRISNPQSWNRYAYALNNPLKFVDANGLEVTYADKRLQAFFTRLSVKYPAVREALGRYTGSGKPDLFIQRGDAGHDPLTGEKSRGAFHPENPNYSYKRPDGSYTVSDPAMKDQMDATGKNLTGASFNKATVTIDTAVTPGTKDEADVAVHEMGHAGSAANDFLRYSQMNAADQTTGPDGKPLPHDDRPLEKEANQFRDRACGVDKPCNPN